MALGIGHRADADSPPLAVREARQVVVGFDPRDRDAVHAGQVEHVWGAKAEDRNAQLYLPGGLPTRNQMVT